MAKNKQSKLVSVFSSDIDLKKLLPKKFKTKHLSPLLYIFVFSLMVGLLYATWQVGLIRREPEIFQEGPDDSPIVSPAPAYLQGRIADANGDPDAGCAYNPYWRPDCSDCTSGFCNPAPDLTVACTNAVDPVVWGCNGCGAYFSTGPQYLSGQQVTCTATNPPDGYKFVSWSWGAGSGNFDNQAIGMCEGDNNQCSINLSSIQAGDNNLRFFIQEEASPQPTPQVTPLPIIIPTQPPETSPLPSSTSEPTEAQLCSAAGGTWKEFPNSCADICGSTKNCLQVVTLSCDCGEGKCWDRQVFDCVSETSVSPPPSASPQGQTTNINMNVKLDGVPANNNIINLAEGFYEQLIRIVFQNSQGEYFYHSNTQEGLENFSFNPDDQIFEGNLVFDLTQLPSGRYNVLVKGPSHRQIKYCRNNQGQEYICQRADLVDITAGQSINLDFAFDSSGGLGHALEFGDVNWDGKVSVADYSWIKECVEKDARLGDNNYTGGCNKADGNFDGVVDNTDIVLLYNTLSKETDDDYLEF